MSTMPSRYEAIPSPVLVLMAPELPFAVEGYAVAFCEKFISPCGSANCMKGNWINRYSAPNLNEWDPFEIARF